jgi:hypothetical protein
MMTPDEFTTPAPDNASFSLDQSCEQGNERRRLADPSGTRGALLPVPATSRWAEQWPRRADEPRQEAQDSVISAQWIELPFPSSPQRPIFLPPVIESDPLEQEQVDEDDEIRLADPSSSGQRQRRGSGNKPRHRSSDEDRQRRGGSGNKPPRWNGKPRSQVRGRGQQPVNQASWPADPFSMPTAPMSVPPTSGWQGKQTWRDDEQRREMRERRAAFSCRSGGISRRSN